MTSHEHAARQLLLKQMLLFVIKQAGGVNNTIALIAEMHDEFKITLAPASDFNSDYKVEHEFNPIFT